VYTWLHSILPMSDTTWDELTKAFLAKFFLHSKTTSSRNQITTFAQRDNEAHCKVWEKLNDLLHLCPHHGFQKWMIAQIFYNRVTQSIRSTIDAIVSGTLMNKMEDEACNLIKGMTLNNY